MIYRRLTIYACARYAALVSPVVTLISGLVFFSRLLGDTAAGNIPPFIFGQLFILTLIKYAPQLLILSAFAGVFIAMRTAYTRHEMDAWFSSGLGLHSFIRPVMIFALPAAAFVALFSLYVSPWAVYSMNSVRAAAAFDLHIDNIPRRQFDSTPGKTHTYFLDGSETLFIASNKKPEIIFARHVQRSSDTALQLSDGQLFYVAADADGNEYMEKMRFGKILLSLPAADSPARIRPRAKSIAAMQWSSPSDRAELVWRLTLPLAVFALALAALFLSPAHSRLGQRFGFLSAIAVFFIYLNGLRFMRDQIAGETLPAAAAAALPPLLIGLVVFALARLFQRR